MEHNQNEPIADQVIGFFSDHFGRIFGAPFHQAIPETLRRKAVLRQVEESADAASQSLTRLLVNEQLDNSQAARLLQGLAPAVAALDLEHIAKPNISPETLVAELLQDHPPPALIPELQQALFRVALHSIVQVLTLVGPVMAEWRKLSFSDSFELPRKIVERLNRISEQMTAQGRLNPAEDERYELTYRDYLMQRFHRVEAGTVKMTANLDVDLRELFVMPKVLPRKTKAETAQNATGLMNLDAARQRFGNGRFHEREMGHQPDAKKSPEGITALTQIRLAERNVLIGAPGGGKSTFLEWLQIQLAVGDEELVMNGQQAIPLLLRIRQLDIQHLPEGIDLIAKATASEDRAQLMPRNWIERQMGLGRVFFMVDGLDETDPVQRDTLILPWLKRLCDHYPYCRFLVSSRPSGYPNGALRALAFEECDLLDFGETEIAEYTCHWCTAVRLSRNEPTQEAHEEGQKDGKHIVAGFRENLYISDLARNPLMLSAICLVNYFEGGKLPQDRALLYRLCVEGLLHHWDQRRGIHSEFGLEEKLRACRELALAMQADDRAEYEAERVQAVFAEALANTERGRTLLEHIRYRAGLLLERRSEVFAFAHLTFQEYLAAQAIHEGNRLGLDFGHLVHGHDDPRWQEVTALYCGLSTDSAALELMRNLMAQPNTRSIGQVLAEAYQAAQGRIGNDKGFRTDIIKRIALAPNNLGAFEPLSIFSVEEVSPIANECLGKMDYSECLSQAHFWFNSHPDEFDIAMQLAKLEHWQQYKAMPLSELVYHLHRAAPIKNLLLSKNIEEIYLSLGPVFSDVKSHECQAEIAIIGLADRADSSLEALVKILLPIFTALSQFPLLGAVETLFSLERLLKNPMWRNHLPRKLESVVNELTRLARIILEKLHNDSEGDINEVLHGWIEQLEHLTGQKKSHPKKKGKRR